MNFYLEFAKRLLNIATIFFLPITKDKTIAVGNYWHTGIIFKNKVYETFNHGRYKISDITRVEELKKYGHGTIIKVTKLNMKTGNKIGTARADLGRRFSPYINRKIIEIKVNDESCRFAEPEIIKGSKRNISIETPSGAKIYGWVGLLEHSSQKGFYGFDTFRYERLITCYDKFGFSSHPNHARIIGELHMGHIPVTMNKREWNKESKE